MSLLPSAHETDRAWRCDENKGRGRGLSWLLLRDWTSHEGWLPIDPPSERFLASLRCCLLRVRP
jgi:hypothetical protein